MEAGVGSIRAHPSTSPRIGPRRKRQGRISEPKTLDDSKQTANWGRSVQSIYEEVGTGCPPHSHAVLSIRHVSVASQNRQLTTSSTDAHYIDHHPKMAFEVGPLTRAWLQQTKVTIMMIIRKKKFVDF